MKKYLSDSEIMNWNDRLSSTPYFVIPRYHTHNSFPMIVFKQRIKTGLGSLFIYGVALIATSEISKYA